MKSMGKKFYLYHYITVISILMDFLGHKLRNITIVTLVEKGLEGCGEKDVGEIIGTGLYVCFSVLTAKQRLGVS
jgi:hypothetical protein